MHTNVSAFHIVFVESVLGGSWNALGGARTQKVMYTTCFSVFGSVFTRRNAASGISLGDSLGDPVRDLGPHMLCTHMFQRFASFSAECVFGGSLGRTWGCLWDPQGFLVGPRGVLGAAWGYLETPWGSLVALGVFLGDSLGGHGVPSGGSLSGPSAPYATHTDVPAFRAFRCSCVILLDYWLLSWS